jgi:hypothetical protein
MENDARFLQTLAAKTVGNRRFSRCRVLSSALLSVWITQRGCHCSLSLADVAARVHSVDVDERVVIVRSSPGSAARSAGGAPHAVLPKRLSASQRESVTSAPEFRGQSFVDRKM